RIEAPGVAQRHLRVKCADSTVFVEPLGQASITLDGQRIVALTRAADLQVLTFGCVVARLERIQVKDRLKALAIPAVAVAPEPAARSAEQHARNLALLNDRLENGPGPTPAELLELFERACAPVALALLRRKGHDWSVLAETAAPGAASLAGETEPDGCRLYTRRTAEGEFLLRVLYAEPSPSAWQDEFARLLLMSGLPVQAPSMNSAPCLLQGSRHVWQAFVGASIRRVLERSTELCHESDTVLLLGETGTGKELAARALHRLWNRPGEFVALNCAAVPGELLESEFFGIEAGTATGVAARSGRIEQARGGTLFLDEIAEMPVELQSKLLRVLQEREYFHVGGRKLLRADVKIVAASNRPDSELREGRMRRDLYFRLAEAKLQLPALRERPEDIAALCEHFLARLEQRYCRGVTGVSVAALELLKGYVWPGNVRELQNMLRNVYACTPAGGLIRKSCLPGELSTGISRAACGSLTAAVLLTERETIERELSKCGTVKAAAGALGISESYLYRLIKKFGMQYAEPRSRAHSKPPAPTKNQSRRGAWDRTCS
ncbi:MAG: sigma 54-interacting transcriptional regulator, partial [Acidobacteria bacterium]|nr:sigma 54-interacting transcriptional regulator [Acidobacteriota bacterium]